MTTYYKATFSGGRVETRSTASRRYTHAVGPGYTSFCGSLLLAEREASARAGKAWRNNEIAEAVEITAAEYRQLKKEAKAHAAA